MFISIENIALIPLLAFMFLVDYILIQLCCSFGKLHSSRILDNNFGLRWILGCFGHTARKEAGKTFLRLNKAENSVDV